MFAFQLLLLKEASILFCGILNTTKGSYCLALWLYKSIAERYFLNKLLLGWLLRDALIQEPSWFLEQLLKVVYASHVSVWLDLGALGNHKALQLHSGLKVVVLSSGHIYVCRCSYLIAGFGLGGGLATSTVAQIKENHSQDGRSNFEIV